MNEATGGAGDLAEVLSYFPDKAELFIKTQEHAAQVEGRKSVWYNIRHQKDGPGLRENEWLSKGQWENLGVSGFTGEYIQKVLDQIDVLRGKGDIPPDTYYQNNESERGIFDAVEAKEKGAVSERKNITLKLLEVKGVTNKEIALMREYREAINTKRELDKQAMVLEQRAKGLRKQGDVIEKEAVQKVIQARQEAKK